MCDIRNCKCFVISLSKLLTLNVHKLTISSQNAALCTAREVGIGIAVHYTYMCMSVCRLLRKYQAKCRHGLNSLNFINKHQTCTKESAIQSHTGIIITNTGLVFCCHLAVKSLYVNLCVTQLQTLVTAVVVIHLHTQTCRLDWSFYILARYGRMDNIIYRVSKNAPTLKRYSSEL